MFCYVMVCSTYILYCIYMDNFFYKREWNAGSFRLNFLCSGGYLCYQLLILVENVYHRPPGCLVLLVVKESTW